MQSYNYHQQRDRQQYALELQFPLYFYLSNSGSCFGILNNRKREKSECLYRKHQRKNHGLLLTPESQTQPPLKPLFYHAVPKESTNTRITQRLKARNEPRETTTKYQSLPFYFRRQIYSIYNQIQRQILAGSSTTQRNISSILRISYRLLLPKGFITLTYGVYNFHS